MSRHDGNPRHFARRTGDVEFDNGGVAMRIRREMRLLHLSDVPDGSEECFGGDSMGHWNIARTNRILDAMRAPAVAMPIPHDVMYAMARVGAPDPARAAVYATMGLQSMPPLTFVSIPNPARPNDVRTMLIDGHHRMLALWTLHAPAAPARILPAALANDVRVIEMCEVAVFPRALQLQREIDLDSGQDVQATA